MAITMTELAALAGLSQTSVSLILNGKADGKISRARQEEVLRLARQHHYRPNAAARSLRNRRQFTIGVIMPTPRNLFYADMVSHLQIALAAEGYMTLFSFWQELNEVEEAFEAVFRHSVDGLISWEYHDCLERQELPAVIYDQKVAGFDAVLLDKQKILEESIHYLMELGHQRIGYVGPHELRSLHLKEALARAGGSYNSAWRLHGSYHESHGHRAIETWLALPASNRPTALLAQNDTVARSVIFAAYQRGVNIPTDLSILGFNNDAAASTSLPPLTTFDSHNDELANALASCIIRRIAHPDQPETCRLIQPTLVIRASCSAPAEITSLPPRPLAT